MAVPSLEQRTVDVYVEDGIKGNATPDQGHLKSFPQVPPKPLNFKVWACTKLGSGNYMLARSQQTVRAASVVFGGRWSMKESEQTSSADLSHPGDGKTSLFEKQHPPGSRACAQRTLEHL